MPDLPGNSALISSHFSFLTSLRQIIRRSWDGEYPLFPPAEAAETSDASLGIERDLRCLSWCRRTAVLDRPGKKLAISSHCDPFCRKVRILTVSDTKTGGTISHRSLSRRTLKDLHLSQDLFSYELLESAWMESSLQIPSQGLASHPC